MTPHLFFHLALTFIFLHEMEAVRCKEWRIFSGLSLLHDFWGYRIFALAHVPPPWSVSSQTINQFPLPLALLVFFTNKHEKEDNYE
jgi:hypothetical protein